MHDHTVHDARSHDARSHGAWCTVTRCSTHGHMNVKCYFWISLPLKSVNISGRMLSRYWNLTFPDFVIVGFVSSCSRTVLPVYLCIHVFVVVLLLASRCLACTPVNWIQLNQRLRSTARAERDGTRAETRFRLSPKRMSPFKSVGASVQSTAGSPVMPISLSNAG